MHAQYPPHPLLEPYLKCIWVAERSFQPPYDVLELLPDSYVELVFSFGADCQTEEGRALPRSYVMGLLERPFRFRAEGWVQTVAARFYAWGFSPLMGFAVGEPKGAVRLDEGLAELRSLLEPLVRRDDLPGAARHLHDFLLERALRLEFEPDELQTAARVLQAEKGAVKIEDLAERCQLSRRQLERKFNRAVGVSPKSLARKIRFETVRDRLWQNPRSDLVALAYDLGYADQAHMNREFKALSGKTPTRFAAEMQGLAEVLRASGVAIVQD